MVQLITSHYYSPRTTKLLGGYIDFTPSVRPSIRPSRIPCPLCSFYSSGWIHFIFMHRIKPLQKVCRVQSFLQNFKIWTLGNFLKFVIVLVASGNDLTPAWCHTLCMNQWPGPLIHICITTPAWITKVSADFCMASKSITLCEISCSFQINLR